MAQREVPPRLVYVDLLRSQPKIGLWGVTVLACFFASFLLVDGLQARIWWEIIAALLLFFAARELAIEAQINHLEYLFNEKSIVCFREQEIIEIGWDAVTRISRKYILWLPIGGRAFEIYDIVDNQGQRIRICPYRLKADQEELRLLFRRLEELRARR